MMDRNDWWDLFASTGWISAYLQYKQEEDRLQQSKTDGAHNNQGDRDPQKDYRG